MNSAPPSIEGWRALALALERVTFLPATWDKRYAHFLIARAKDPEASLRPDQFERLVTLCHKYRRQLGGTR